MEKLSAPSSSGRPTGLRTRPMASLEKALPTAQRHPSTTDWAHITTHTGISHNHKTCYTFPWHSPLILRPFNPLFPSTTLKTRHVSQLMHQPLIKQSIMSMLELDIWGRTGRCPDLVEMKFSDLDIDLASSELINKRS